jgi:DHA1 family inner membrane transport protein
MRVMRIAREAPILALAINIGAFNLGNALGAAVGGWRIDVGRGYRAVLSTAAGLDSWRRTAGK